MITLVVGGTRSGKSAVAERLASAAADGRPVTYLATALADPTDDDHRARIAAHRHRRPPHWVTVECGADLAGALLAAPTGTVLVDSVGTWVAAHPRLDPDVSPVLAALAERTGPTVVVAEEVGLGGVAPTAVGGRFADAVGEVNQALAHVATEVLLVVAGRALRLPDAR